MAEVSVPVWPRLDRSQAEVEFDLLLSKNPIEAQELVDLQVNAVRFYETATHRVDSAKLRNLREKVIDLASNYGFPDTARSDSDLSFDQRLAMLFSVEVPMLEVEAALPGVWHFLTLRVLPDVAIWRWPGNDPKSKFEEDGGRLRTHRLKDNRRNVFRQAWFRQNLLSKDACRIFDEDAFVQMTDRITLLGNSSLNQILVHEAVQIREREGYNRQVLRTALRYVGQSCGRISVESLGRDGIARVIGTCFSRAFDEQAKVPTTKQNRNRPQDAETQPDLLQSQSDATLAVHSVVEAEYLRLAGVYGNLLARTLGPCDYREAVDLLGKSKEVLHSRTKPRKSQMLKMRLQHLVDHWSSLSRDQHSVVASTLRFSIHSVQDPTADQWRVLDAPERVLKAAYQALGV